MHQRMTAVESSNVAGYAYLEEPKVLVVAFKNDASYRYNNVPKDVMEEFAKADSKGKFLNLHIKKTYDWALLDEDGLESLFAQYPETKRRQKTATKPQTFSPAEIVFLRETYPVLRLMF